MCAANSSSELDLKLRSILDYAHKNWDIHREVKTPWLEPISGLLRLRTSRLRTLMTLPSGIASVSQKMQRALDESHFEVLGTLHSESISEEERHSILARTNQLLISYSDENLRRRTSGDPTWDETVLEEHKQGLVTLQIFEAAHTRASLEALLFSYISGAWSTIETMLGDLWELSLNCHPQRIANLNGQPKRIQPGQAIPKRRATTARESKVVDLDLISENNFDVRAKMGTILKPRFSFSRLEGVREAYSRAFDKDSTRIDKALSDTSLDSLNAVRNLIIHQDARVDAEYKKRSKFLRNVPKAELGDQIPIDGDIVVSLLKPAFAAADSVLRSVDEWMAMHPIKNSSD